MNHTTNHIKNSLDKNEGNKEDFKDDYIVASMGAFGRWQLQAVTIVATSRLIALWNLLSVYFLTATTVFICKRFKNNATVQVNNSTCYDNCLEYEYYHEAFDKNIISEFDLICDRAWLASMTQTILMLGLVLGVSMFGWISDRFGRRKAMIISATLDVIFMCAASFAPSFWIFTVLRFFVGLASGGIITLTAVFTSEVVGPQHRELVGGLALTPDGLAEATLALFAYFSSTWNEYLLEFTGASFVILIMLFFIPETPRWLVANGKGDEAVQLMSRAATMNNLSTINIKDNVTKSIEALNLKENEGQNLNYTDLFKTKKLCIITMSSIIVWFVTGLCYYGINQYTTVLGSNIFIVVAVIGLAQVPTGLLSSLLAMKFGRKASIIGCLVVIGTSMIVLIFIPLGTWISTSLGMIGVAVSCTVFCLVYLHVTELYPTPMRNMGFALSSSASKVGAMVAPFVANLEPQWVASLVFAVLPFIAAGFCILLPETKGKKLSDTVEK